MLDTLLMALLAMTGSQPGSEGTAERAEVVIAQAQVAPKPDPTAPKPTPPPKDPAAKPPATKPEGDAQAARKAPPPMAADVKALVDRMQAFYEQTQDFTADFEQRYTYKAFKRTQVSTGTVVFKKPALMRWEYLTPAKKTFVLAGDKVYAYDPEAMLLTRANIATNQLSASVTFLWGQGKLAEEFAIEKTACKACKGTQLTMTPLQPDPRFRQILLEVDPKTAQVLKSTVIDPDGSENAITFKNTKTNTGVGADTFKLDPPEGTQIQDFTQAGRAP